jgi:hypothetical protein
MRLLKRFCVLLLGLAMALAMSSVVRADAVTDWNAIAIQIISNAPCPAAPCANPPVHPGATGTLDSAMVQTAVYDAVESITGRFRPYAVHVPGASGSTATAVAKAALTAVDTTRNLMRKWLFRAELWRTRIPERADHVA